MSMKKNPDGSYSISPRTPGAEAAAFGAGFAPDINGDGSFGGLEGGIEVTSGGLLSYGIYTAVMTTLDTIPARRAGVITPGQQRQIILDRTWEVTKGAVPTVVILGAVLAVCPWLGGIAWVGGLVGAGFMTTRLIRAGWDALTDEQRASIQTKADEVQVKMPDAFTTNDPDGSTVPAVG